MSKDCAAIHSLESAEELCTQWAVNGFLNRLDSDTPPVSVGEIAAWVKAFVLRLELDVMQRPKEESSKRRAGLKHVRMPTFGSDQALFWDFYREWLIKNGCKKEWQANVHYRKKETAIKDFERSGICLKRKYGMRTYKQWITNFKKYQKLQRGES